MSVQLQPNGTGTVIDTFATVAAKERQVVLLNAPPATQWAVAHTPAAATQATISQAAGAAGVRNVCTSISCTISTVGTAQTAALVFVLRDGASGAGTVLWSQQISLPVNTTFTIQLSGLSIPGTAATAMTLETVAANVAASFSSVSMSGYTTA
jgi:hypothetical protein